MKLIAGNSLGKHISYMAGGGRNCYCLPDRKFGIPYQKLLNYF